MILTFFNALTFYIVQWSQSHSHVKRLPCSPTLTDRLRATPGAVVKAGPLSRASKTKSRLAAKTQQALGFKFFPSKAGTMWRHAWIPADSRAYTYINT